MASLHDHEAAVNHHDLLRPPDELSHADFELIVRRLADDLAFGTDASLFVGGGLEYAQSRPYEPGDPVRQLDWRISAKTGRAYVKQYETLKRIAMYLVIDTSSSMSVSSTRLTKHDLAIWIAAAVGLVGLRRLSPVGVVGAGERETRLVPSLARGDLWQALEPLRSLAYAETTTLGERIRSLEPRVSRSSLMVVISDLHDPDSIPALRHASQRHDVIVLHLEDPAERGRLRAGFVRGVEAETGTTFLAAGRTRWRDDCQISRELARAGVSYLHLRTDMPFVPLLRHFLGSRGATRHAPGPGMRWACLIMLCVCTSAFAQTIVKRGITGAVTFEYDGPKLVALLDQDLSAPLLLRLERTSGHTYTARFIGAVEGDYDLRTLIRHRNGAMPADLTPLDVRIVSNLPDGFETDLYDAADMRPAIASGYWRTATILGILWISVPLVVIIRRLMRPKPQQETVAEAPRPSLADQLRPLVTAAAARELTLAEQARLELLLLHYWRERIAADAPDVAAAIMIIRRHPEAGELLEAVESWLHKPDRAAHDPARLEALLAPYRAAAPMDERALANAETAVPT